MSYDFVIIGAGLFGATCARLLTDAGKSALVVERRDVIGGNCHDALINGVPVGRYGGHIFHTNSRKIWDYVNRFDIWRQYEHRVKAKYQGKLYSLPPNLATFDAIGELPGPVGEKIIRRMFFEGYSQKQWGKPMSQIPASVLARVPIRYTYDDRYFTDRFQGVPENGYTTFINNMLCGVPVELNADYLNDRAYWERQGKTVIYSGALDEFFGFDLGHLEYRSLEWRHQVIEADDYQGCPTVNYTEACIPYTRILEWRHFGWRKAGKETLISIEYPRSKGEPYYPVNDETNQELYRRYQLRLNDLPYLYVGGRLGSYRYYNMDQVIAQAMTLVESEAAA